MVAPMRWVLLLLLGLGVFLYEKISGKSLDEIGLEPTADDGSDPGGG